MACTIDNNLGGSVANKASYMKEDAGDADADDDLFEIDLDFLDKIPPPQYYEAHLTADGIVLLANCLLPIDDISSAIPIKSSVEPMRGKSSQLSEVMARGKCWEEPHGMDWYALGELRGSPRPSPHWKN